MSNEGYEWEPSIGDFVQAGNLDNRGKNSFTRQSGGLCGVITKIKRYTIGEDRVLLREPEMGHPYHEMYYHDNLDGFYVGTIWGDLQDVFPVES